MVALSPDHCGEVLPICYEGDGEPLRTLSMGLDQICALERSLWEFCLEDG